MPRGGHVLVRTRVYTERIVYGALVWSTVSARHTIVDQKAGNFVQTRSDLLEWAISVENRPIPFGRMA